MGFCHFYAWFHSCCERSSFYVQPFGDCGHRLSPFCYERKHRQFVECTMSDPSLGHSCRLFLFVVNVVIAGILVVVGIIGNSFTFAVFWKGNFKSSTSFLFMCLAISDSAVLLTSPLLFSIMPFIDYTGYMKGFLNTLYRDAAELVNCLTCIYYMAQATTIWVTVLIAVNRYIIVCLPLRAPQWCTNTKVKIQMAAVLLLAVLYNTPKFVMIFSAPETHQLILLNVLYAICILILPICILAMLNIRLIKSAECPSSYADAESAWRKPERRLYDVRSRHHRRRLNRLPTTSARPPGDLHCAAQQSVLL